jgi:hypothetical protein
LDNHIKPILSGVLKLGQKNFALDGEFSTRTASRFRPAGLALQQHLLICISFLSGFCLMPRTNAVTNHFD